MKALIEYTVRQRIRDVSSLSVTVEATSLQGHVRNLYVNEGNLAKLQKIEVCLEDSVCAVQFVKKVKQSLYSPGQAQRVQGS